MSEAAAPAGFLHPYRVLDLTDARGLLAGHLMAQLGAEVVQVEPVSGSSARRELPIQEDGPEGPRSLFWATYAAGKKSVTLDLEQAEGRALLLRLAAEADVVLESASPGEMARKGLGYEAFRAANPRIVHASITAFGPDGPKAGYAESDLAIWASAGAMDPHRTPDGLPLRISVPQAFHQAAMDAVCGVLIALIARGDDGPGQHVEVTAQQSCMLCTLSSHLASAVRHPDFNLRGGVQNAKLLDLSGSGIRTRKTKWETRDGLVEMHIGMGPAAGRYANALLAWVNEVGDLPPHIAAWDWVEIPGRIERGEVTPEELEVARGVVADVIARHTKDELMRIAQDRSLLMAPVMDAADLVASPQFAARGFFVDVGEGDARVSIPAPFETGCGAGSAASALQPAPRPGEHNAEVYGALGLDAAALADLERRGIV